MQCRRFLIFQILRSGLPLNANHQEKVTSHLEKRQKPGLLQRFADINDQVGPSNQVSFVSPFKRTYSSNSGKDKHTSEKEQEKQKEQYSKMPSNIEIKAHLRDPEQLRTLVILQLHDGDSDIMEQVDTFFYCKTGRLKLREIVNHPTRPAKLISYIRPDQDGPKHSKFSITEVEDAESLKRTLGMALGVRGVVKKTRTLMMIGQTKLHIDEVEGLGNFLELEVCLKANQTQEEGIEIANGLMKKLSIHQSDLISGAYMDLLES